MVLAPFLLLGVRGFGTLVVSILEVVGFTSHGRAGRDRSPQLLHSSP